MLHYFITGLYSFHAFLPTPRTVPMFTETMLYTLQSTLYMVRVLPIAIKRESMLRKIKHNSSLMYPNKRLGIHGKH